MIIKYKTTTTINEYRIGIQAKEALLNFSEAIPKYLVYLHDYFPNGRSNRKRIYSKFRILYNEDINKIMLAVKDDMMDYKFYVKCQPLQYYDIICIRWLHWYIDKADCTGLEAYLIPRVAKLLKHPTQLAYSTKSVFTGEI